MNHSTKMIKFLTSILHRKMITCALLRMYYHVYMCITYLHLFGATYVRGWGPGYHYGSTWGVCPDLVILFLFFFSSGHILIPESCLPPVCHSVSPHYHSHPPVFKKTFITTLCRTSPLVIELPQKSMILLPQALCSMRQQQTMTVLAPCTTLQSAIVIFTIAGCYIAQLSKYMVHIFNVIVDVW